MFVGVLLRERFDGFEKCRDDLWLVAEVLDSSFSNVGEETLDEGDDG